MFEITSGGATYKKRYHAMINLKKEKQKLNLSKIEEKKDKEEEKIQHKEEEKNEDEIQNHRIIHKRYSRRKTFTA